MERARDPSAGVYGKVVLRPHRRLRLPLRIVIRDAAGNRVVERRGIVIRGR